MAWTTWNPSDKNSHVALSGGNLVATHDEPSALIACVRAKNFQTSGKRYCELTFTTAHTFPTYSYGIAQQGVTITGDNYQLGFIGSDDAYSYKASNGDKGNRGVDSVYGASFGNGAIISILVDLDAHTISYWKNGVNQGTAATDLTVGGSYAITACLLDGTIATANFGASAWAYAPPSGYIGWDDGQPTPGNAAVTLEKLLISGSRIASAAVTLEKLTVLGGYNGYGAAVLSALTVAATGRIDAGAVTLAAMTALGTGRSANQGTVVLEAFIVAGTGHSSAIVTFAKGAPAPRLSATAIAGTVTTADLRAPMPLLVAIEINTTRIVTNLFASAPRLNSTSLTGNVLTAALRAAIPVLAAAGYPGGTITASFVVPAPRVYSVFGSAVLSAYRTWVLNTRKDALTEYGSEFAFNSFAEFNGQVLACNSNGIVVLGAQKLDNAAPIDAIVRTGAESFASSLLKRVPRLYTSYSSDGDMIFRTITAEGGTRSYSLPFNGAVTLQQRRVPVGKGPKSRFFQFELANVGGADFEINDILVYPTMLRRRVQ